MKIAVMGAGGVGGYYGAVLARSGEDVTFIARGAHLQALKRNGLKVETQAQGTFALQAVKATDKPAEIGPVDLILFATKAYDLEGAAASLKPCLGADTMILPLLNGVDIAERIAAVVGRSYVLGGMCQISASIQSPGAIRVVGPLNKIVFGELAGGASPRAEAVLNVLLKAGINVDLSPQVLVDIWNKFLFIAALGGVCTLTATVLGPVRADPDTRALLVGVMEEVYALARRQNIPLKPSIVLDTLANIDKLPEGSRPSMLLSLEQGGKLEVDALNGTATRLGKQLDVPTPINAFIYAALKLRAEGRRA